MKLSLNNMTLNEFQQKCRLTAIYNTVPPYLYSIMGLANEAGELLGKLKKKYRDGHFDVEAAADELGDVAWYVANAAHDLGYTLEEICQRVVDKLEDRQNRGVLQGSGDKR